jgi:hypothetical protein
VLGISLKVGRGHMQRKLNQTAYILLRIKQRTVVNKCERQKRVPQQVAGEWKLRAERKLQTSRAHAALGVPLRGDFGDATMSRSANEVQGRAAAHPQLRKILHLAIRSEMNK